MQFRPIGEDASELATAFEDEPFVDFSRLSRWNERRIPGREAWVARQDGACVGIVVIDSLPEKAVDLTLAVVRGKRRQGVGTALLGFVVKHCLRLGKTRICALIDGRNDLGLAFFTAAGFQSEPTQLRDHVRLFLRVEPLIDEHKLSE